jgi:hypothetical protein
MDASTKSEHHIYQVRPRKDKRGVDLISDALPFGRLLYDGPGVVATAIGYAKHSSRSHRLEASKAAPRMVVNKQ